MKRKVDKPYRVYHLPDMAKLNPELHRMILSRELVTVKDGEVKIEELKVLFKFIELLTPIAVSDIAKSLTQNINTAVRPGGSKRFKLMDYWGVNYEKGQAIIPHTHYPMTLSFSYYVNTPKGCSPLLIDTGFEDDQIFDELHLKACDVVFFASHLFHTVRPEPIGDRSIIAGNMLYYDNGPKDGEEYSTMADYTDLQSPHVR
jgi:hypothetical protein